MFWLGLASAIDAPGWLRATIPFGWASLSATLPFALWRRDVITPFHFLGLAFLLYAAISIAWAPIWQDALGGLWQWVLLGLAFQLGSTLTSSRSILLGMAVSLWLSSAFAIAQLFGNHTLLTAGGYPGLFYNSMIAGEYATLIIIGLVVYREWLAIAGVIPSLLLSHSRGAWLALAFGLIAAYFRSWWLLAAFVICALLGVLYFHNPDDDLRLHIWQVAIQSLYPFGWGVGSFIDVLLPPIHPEYTHNDFLQLAFEFGLGSAPLLLLIAFCALSRRSMEWPILTTGLFMACFSFPLYAPISAFLMALCAGRIVGDWACDCCDASEWGLDKLSRGAYSSVFDDPAWS